MFMSFDNGATWEEEQFNLFNLQDGQLYLGADDKVFKVSIVDNKINSEEYADYVGLPTKQ